MKGHVADSLFPFNLDVWCKSCDGSEHMLYFCSTVASWPEQYLMTAVALNPPFREPIACAQLAKTTKSVALAM